MQLGENKDQQEFLQFSSFRHVPPFDHHPFHHDHPQDGVLT